MMRLRRTRFYGRCRGFAVRNGQEVEGSEDDLRRLYVQAQAAQRWSFSLQQLEQLDQQFAAEGG